ncbi:MAG TPA: DUF2130 domain-containing protein, partial [Burkholderiales bacterium]
MPRMIIIDAAEEVACPKCAHTFALSEGISRQAIERHAEDFDQQLAQRAKQLEADLAAEAKRRAEREAAREISLLKETLASAEQAAASAKQAVASAKAEAQSQLEKARTEAAAAAREAFELDLKSTREALAAKEDALSRFRAEELDLRRKLREADDARRNQELDYQRKLDDERRRIQESSRTAAAEEFSRKEAQMRAQIESAQREAADLKRKLEQGSQQLQGEALEAGLEEMLRAAFPMDEIAEVPKGVSGADLLQRVRSASGQICGTIVWEAKQTKAFQAAWLQKLKDDQQAVGAEIAVLVTSTMPKDVREPFVRQADVWVTGFAAARPLAEALRVTLVEMHKLRQANLGRSEKMALVYEYICSPQFAQKVKSVVEGFRVMREELEAERAAMTRIWKKREMQLQRMTSGMLGVVGDLQGIGDDVLAGSPAIASLPGAEEVLSDESA